MSIGPVAVSPVAASAGAPGSGTAPASRLARGLHGVDDGLDAVPVDGELELLPGVRLLPAPGHTRGIQVVVVDTGEHPTVIAGDVAVWFGQLDDPQDEGQHLVRALDPELVWLAHETEPWRPEHRRDT